MFIDTAKIWLQSGDGGNGIVAFQREKFLPFGGPSGGDGGHGGGVFMVADVQLATLMDFRYRTHFRAKRGMHGQGDNKSGKKGEDLVIKVPPGTMVKDAETGDVLFEILKPGVKVLVAAGGKGGKGNQHFATPTNQAPRYAQDGTPGIELAVVLELKLFADVGLVGFPNVGKSTLLSRVSAAKPKIADYPFTTLQPHLGVVNLGNERSFVLVDIPGLIEGAHEGKGLGHEFLRHVERTRALIHMVDVSGFDGRDPVEDYEAIMQELRLYSPELAERPLLVAANKSDLPGSAENAERLSRALSGVSKVYPVSAVTGSGVRDLMEAAYTILRASSTDKPAK